jgi:hypothetical protein
MPNTFLTGCARRGCLRLRGRPHRDPLNIRLWTDPETSEPVNDFRLLGHCGRNLLASRISQGGPQRNCRKGLTISTYFGRSDDEIGESR